MIQHTNRNAVFFLIAALWSAAGDTAHAQATDDPANDTAPAIPDPEVPDKYSVGQDGVVASILGEQPYKLFWSDFARYMIRRGGASAAWGMMNQLTYVEILRQEMARRGLKVRASDVETELWTAMTNSIKGDPRHRDVKDLEDFLQRIKVQMGMGRSAYEAFNWGFAAQSIVLADRVPMAERQRMHESGDSPTGRPSLQVAHILCSDEAKIRELHKRLEAGEDWNVLAWQYTEDFTTLSRSAPDPANISVEGGVGFVLGALTEFRGGECMFGRPMEDAAAAITNPGEYSQPFQSEFGWHIVRLLKRVPPRSFADSAGTIAGALSGKQLNELRSEADVEVLILRDRDWSLEPYAGSDVVVARVGNQELMLSDFGRMLYLNHSPREGASHLRNMVEEYALVLEASDRGITVSDEELEARLHDGLRAAIAEGSVAPGTTVPEWLGLRSNGARMSPEQWRINMRFDLLIEKARAALTDEQSLHEYFANNKSEFTDVYETRTIRIFHFDGRRTKEECQTLADDLLKRLERQRSALPAERLARRDEDYFKILVEQYSEHQSGVSTGGIDHPWRVGLDERGGTSGLGFGFESAVAAAGLHGAGAAEIHGGIAIFEVIGHTKAPTFEQARDAIVQRVQAIGGRNALARRGVQYVPDLLGIPDSER